MGVYVFQGQSTKTAVKTRILSDSASVQTGHIYPIRTSFGAKVKCFLYHILGKIDNSALIRDRGRLIQMHFESGKQAECPGFPWELNYFDLASHANG